jgi:hypothetical protein
MHQVWLTHDTSLIAPFPPIGSGTGTRRHSSPLSISDSPSLPSSGCPRPPTDMHDVLEMQETALNHAGVGGMIGVTNDHPVRLIDSDIGVSLAASVSTEPRGAMSPDATQRALSGQSTPKNPAFTEAAALGANTPRRTTLMASRSEPA